MTVSWAGMTGLWTADTLQMTPAHRVDSRERRRGERGRRETLFDQRAVAVTVKAIPLVDRVLIRAQDEIAARKRRDEHQQSRPGKMKISEESARDEESEARQDEETRFALPSDDSSR